MLLNYCVFTLAKSNIIYEMQDLYSCPSRLTYCEQVSCEQFEEQKLTDSQQALAELLDQIIQDSKMGSKEKKKRLKMVRIWPHQSGSITSSFQYVGFERDVFRVIRDHFRNLEFPLITACLYESFMNAYSYVKYIESVSHTETSEAKFQSAESKVPSKSLEDLFHNVAPVTKERYSKPESISHPPARESYQSHEASGISLNSSKVSSSNKVVTDKVSPTKFDDSVSSNPSNMESLQFINTDKLFSASLPPNTCFETAFTSESPVTRIIPRKLVEDIHLSHKQRCSKSLSRNASFVEPHSLSLGTNHFSVPSASFSSKIKRNASASNVTDSNFQGQCVKTNPVRYSYSNVKCPESCSESLPSYTGFTSAPISNSDKHALLANQGKLKKSLPEESEENVKRKKKIKSENVMKVQHVRNQSGGYINLALSYSADEIGKSECFDQLLGEDLDYNAALETLQNLMKCSSSYEERKPHSDSCDEIGNLNYSSASSLWSYHTADSGEHSFHTPTPPLSSFQESDDVRNWACDIITNSGIQTLKGQQLGIELLQLLLLLLPPVNRYKLQLLLCFMSNIEDNGRLVLEDGVCTRNLLLDTFTNSILRPELPQQGDENISRHIVAFFLDNHEILFDVPSGLKAEVDLHLAQMNKQVSGKFVMTFSKKRNL
ncbi:hypothetical protein J437_LFUL016441 [Ladona fulva]|uniref:Uncharacterized protein n=1 Tax=Ladona fulva TaxID=123851 RepID=A0A8K0KMW7_LADFU|nr:hypothetical protein J437_LFUL016441 [Ladona fulva]